MARIADISTSSIPSGRNYSNPEVKPSVSQQSAAAISNDIKSSRGESSKTDHSKISGKSIIILLIVSAALALLVYALAELLFDSENSENIGSIAFAATALGGSGVLYLKSKHK